MHLPAVGLTFAALDFILIITTQFYVFGFLIATVMIIASLAYLVYLYRAHQKEQQDRKAHKCQHDARGGHHCASFFFRVEG